MTKHYLRAFAALLAIVAVSLVAAPRAAADSASDPHCNYDSNGSFNACLRFEWAGYGWMHAHVGIDRYVPEQYGREIVACGADFKASLWGDDGGGNEDDFIRDLVVDPGWPTAWSRGISAELTAKYLDPELDEDKGSDRDELYARVSYFDCHDGWRHEYRTGEIVGDFR